MTCHEARELYSALVDDALDAGERGAVEAHVAGCAECRRELERFRRTVALMQGAGPVRAPAGFVDRVLEAAAPTPWYRRLARVLFSPLGVKVPLGAAAMLLVAGIAVYVFQHSPELQQAARHEAPPVPYSAPPAAPVAPPPAPAAPPAAPVPPPSVSLPPGAGRVGPPATQPAPPAAAEKSPAPPSGGGSAGPSARASDQFAKGARPGRSSDGAKSEARKADAQGVAPAPGPRAPAGPSEGANRARVESPRPDGTDAGGRTDQASSVAKKVDESSRGSSAAEGKPAESRAPESRTGEARAKEAERRAEGKGAGVRPERATEPAAPPARERVLPSVLSDPPAGDRQGALAREDKSGATPPPATAPAPRPMMKSAPAPASPPTSASDARVQARPQLRQETAAALAPGADVAARLAVPDRAAALRALAELLARAGGREVARRADADADAVDLLVPRERYTDFLQSLAQVGRLSLDREPGAMPGQVRVVLRIVHGGS